MSEHSIDVQHISKQFTIRHTEAGYVALRDVLTNAIKKPFAFAKQKARDLSGRNNTEIFWALKDVSFQVEQGEAIGIIGANGAGKSTLLKILSKITPPSEGRAIIRGRVASLLEVGTGFHPELTGRENIFLNGVILGMTKKEIIQRFDEIVAFAGVEKFLDTPVKRYSSGMQVRLAFSVAAHMDPEILLVDEVLAVGDTAFQKKSLGKMNEVTKKVGRTVLFVSHNMGAVQNLCSRSVLLEHGSVVAIGDTDEVVDLYLERSGGALFDTPLKERADRKGNQQLMITDIRLYEDNKQITAAQTGKNLTIKLSYCAPEVPQTNIALSLDIYSIMGQRVAMLSNEYMAHEFSITKKEGEFVCEIPRLSLNTGQYNATIYLTANGVVTDWVTNAFNITVEDGNFFGHGKNPESHDGSLLLPHNWKQNE